MMNVAQSMLAVGQFLFLYILCFLIISYFIVFLFFFFFFSSRRRHTRWNCDWSSDVCSSDLLAVGTRLQDFTTGSRALVPGEAALIQLNIQAFDAGKHRAVPLVGDAKRTLEDLTAALGSYKSSQVWQQRTAALIQEWNSAVDQAMTPTNAPLPTDAQVVGAVNRAAQRSDIVVC